MAIVTADHVIEPVDTFQSSLTAAFDLVAQEPLALVTFGIVPTHGHTGLGYIHRGDSVLLKSSKSAYRVQAFKEKPDKATADRYVESGRYYWNSGMFVWRADTVLAELARFLPAAHAGWMQIAAAWNSPAQQQTLQSVYPTLQKISIDFALMEPASQKKGDARVYTIEMPVEWLDIGSWPALAETLPVDDHDNATDCETCVFLDSDNNIVISRGDPGHLISTIGLSDMVIVHTPDITLVCPKNEAQRVKELVAKVKAKFADKYL
jgi:mannose-1-phosphate guanylyltransferase